MEIWSFISTLRYFSPTYPLTIIIISVTKKSTISFWMIHCTDVVLIPSFNSSLCMKRMKRFWMISTLENVVVIFLGWLQPRKSFVLGISGLQYSKIVMRWLRNSRPVNTSILKTTPTLLLYTLSLQLALLPNGVLILCIVILPQLGAWLHHWSRGLFHKMG